MVERLTKEIKNQNDEMEELHTNVLKRSYDDNLHVSDDEAAVQEWKSKNRILGEALEDMKSKNRTLRETVDDMKVEMQELEESFLRQQLQVNSQSEALRDGKVKANADLLEAQSSLISERYSITCTIIS